MKIKPIKNENNEVKLISLLLSQDMNNNVLKQYLNPKEIDFSLKSLKIVDSYLEKIRKEKNKLNEKEIKQVVLRCGTYLGEVIRNIKPKKFIWISYDVASRIYKGKIPLEQDITTNFILYDKRDEKFWFPLAKSYKFIEYGKSDSLWAFAKVCLEESKENFK